MIWIKSIWKLNTEYKIDSEDYFNNQNKLESINQNDKNDEIGAMETRTQEDSRTYNSWMYNFSMHMYD